MNECLSLIPKLEPLLGIAMAMNLAFLNLPIFSFVDVISKEVDECLSCLKDGTRNEIGRTEWFKDAESIAKIHSLKSIDLSEEPPRWIRFKSWWVAIPFNILFYRGVGKLLSILSVIFCAIFISAGVAADVYPLESGMCKVVQTLGANFTLSVFSFIWPVICVAFGAFIRRSVLRETRYNLKYIGKEAVKGAADALMKTENAVKDATSSEK